jgi:hypothetical protein
MVAEGNTMAQDITAIRQPLKPVSVRTVIILTVLSLILWDRPEFQWLLFPVKTFVIALHEFSHAITCMATGGSVTGMTMQVMAAELAVWAAIHSSISRPATSEQPSGAAC